MPRLPGVRRLFRLPGAERDVPGAVDDELAFHLEMLVADAVAAGEPPDAARRAALARFGDVDAVRRRCHDISSSHESAMRRSDLLATFRQDLVYAARGAWRARGFSLVVLLTLALGIGATTAMFSVVRGVLLRPLPFPDADRVVLVAPANAGANVPRGQISVTELADWERELRGFAAVGAYRALGAGRVFGEPGQEPVYARTTYVSRGFFPALGSAARLGRTLLPAEHEPGANRVVVVSHGFWQAQLGGDPGAVGRTIRLGDEPFTVAGVMPPEFAFPAPDVAVWMPSSVLTEDDVGSGRVARWLEPVARLAPGVTPEQGRAEVSAMLGRLAALHPEASGGWTGVAMQPIREAIVGRVERGLLVLLGAVGLVLLVVCANVANLLLVRATGRAREMALRTAIGAPRGRVVRLLLTESLLLAVVGGTLGVALAWWGVRAVLALSGDHLPRAADVRLDLGVLGFAVGVSLLTGLVFGLWPALRASSTQLAGTLREGARGSAGGVASSRARGALVAAEVALAVVLVAGAGLMLRSFQRLTSVDPGFHPERALVARFSIDGNGESAEDRIAVRRRLAERVREIPGVTGAGVTTFAPFYDGQGEPLPFAVPGQPAPAPGEEPRVAMQPVSPGYLRALGVPLLAGGDIDSGTGDSTAASAIVSRAMAERFWPGRTPIGETFTVLGEIQLRVVGVAGDVRSARLDSVGGFTAYVAEQVMPRSHVSLVVQTAGDPARLVGAVRAAIRKVLPGQAIREIVPLQRKLDQAAATPRFFTVLVGVFGALALVLAAVGLYGIVSYVVRQREREIGVRVALGAPPARVVRQMLRRGLTPVAVGLAVGLPTAFLATRLLRSLLYEVRPGDPLTFVAVAALLGAVALVASWLPSRRAARVDPTVTLRAE